jgi:hypothetical protein
MYDDVQTGDVILSVWENLLGYGIRFITHCEYHHVVVAIRIDPHYLPKIKVVATGGKLCIIENKIKVRQHNGKSYKCILRELPMPNKRYKYIYRSLNEKYKNRELLKNTKNYINSNICEYLDNKGKITLISKVMGSDKNDIPYNKRSNFLNGVCSEISYSYYNHCLGNDVIPSNHYIYSPKNFRHGYMNNIFSEEKMLINSGGDEIFDSTQWWIYLLVILVIVIIVALIIKFKKK